MPLNKVQPFLLQSSVSGTYGINNTTVVGDYVQKNLSGSQVIGGALCKWIDLFTLSTGEIALYVRGTSSGRLYAITATGRIMMGTHDMVTGDFSYVGKIIPSLPVGTNTIRGFCVDDTNLSNIRIAIATVNSTTAQYGGCVFVNKLTLADFTSSGTVIPYALSSDAKACYKLDSNAAIGISALNTVADGIDMDLSSKIIYVPNGVAATHVVFVYSYSSGPTWSDTVCTAQITSGTSVFTLTGHGFLANEQVVLTQAVPTAFTQTIAGAQVVYYVRGATVTANTFELSLTAGGAAILATSTTTPFVGRANGVTGSNFSLKTAQLAPNPFSGTILLTDTVKVFTPGHSVLSGQKCLMIGCNTSIFVVPLSDITNNTLTLPNALSINILGATNEIVTPAALIMDWSQLTDSFVYSVTTTKVISKQLVNNVILDKFGTIQYDYLEGVSQTNLIPQLGAVTVTSIHMSNGWIYMVGSTVGQRGVLAAQVRSNSGYGLSYVVTRVFDVEQSSAFLSAHVQRVQTEKTNPPRVDYRTNLTTDFTSISTGWSSLPDNLSMAAVNPAGVNKIQFRIKGTSVGEMMASGPQITEGYFSYLPASAMSDYWDLIFSQSSENTPVSVSFRQKKAYPTVPANLTMLGYDTSVPFATNTVTMDLISNAASIEYSTDGGLSYSPYSSLGNTVGHILRFKIASPNPIRQVFTLKE